MKGVKRANRYQRKRNQKVFPELVCPRAILFAQFQSLVMLLFILFLFSTKLGTEWFVIFAL